jgi:hypothetical protein
MDSPVAFTSATTRAFARASVPDAIRGLAPHPAPSVTTSPVTTTRPTTDRPTTDRRTTRRVGDARRDLGWRIASV